MLVVRIRSISLVLVCVLAAACGDDGNTADTPDAGPEPLSTAHCSYEPLPANARAGGTVTAGTVQVGVAQNPLLLPIGTALGGNTSRAVAIGNEGKVDIRKVELSGAFNPSVGVETIPRAKAVAIAAGDEKVVIVRTDTIFSDDTITNEVADRLGADYHGKVIWASSHTHTAAEQYSADSKLQVGGGIKRGLVREQLIDAITETAEESIAALAPARIGIAVQRGFDPDNLVSFDRRPENDYMFGGEAKKDEFLAVVRIDTVAGDPLAILPIFGVHSAILDDDVALFSTDVSGIYERLIEEQFDQEVLVVHLQGAAGDVLASYERHVAFPDDAPRMDFAMTEANGRRFLPLFLPLYEAAGADMKSELAMEMVTRSIEMGPDWRTFTVRDGALAYAPFDGVRPADREIFDADGNVISPIDEFNAPGGAGLCGDPADDIFQGARMPNVDDLGVYHSCAQLGDATAVLGALIDAPFEPVPLCSSTRATVSALRLGEYVFATAPGEPVVPWAEHVRSLSPVDPDKTIVLGYAQGHIGYILTADDWLQGGFEPSINVWGPLEGERLAEALAEIMALVVTDEREDGAAGGTDRVASPTIVDDIPAADPAPMAGTVPETIPDSLYLRSQVVPASPQPEPTIPRVSGVARFVWIGEDPLSGTPQVTLQREVDGTFQDVRRRSGRPVQDLDLLLTWTPDPLRRDGDNPRTHYWAVEWQAVTWLGAAEGELGGSLADRAGIPEGRYRFHVEGSGYQLSSEPFEVVPGALTVTAERSGDDLMVTAHYQTSPGWRLLVMEGLSNEPVPVPVENGQMTVELTYSGGTEPAELVALTAPGQLVVSLAPDGLLTSVKVTDRFGNEGSIDLPQPAAQ